MKTDEFKLRISNFLESMIDTYYGNMVVGERLLNYTLKIILKNNIYKIDPILELFQDQSGEIDANGIIQEYVDRMGSEKLTFDLRSYVNNDMLKSLLPDKSLVITAQDLVKVLH